MPYLMFSLAKGAFAVSGETALAMAVAIGASVVAPIIAKGTKIVGEKSKYNDDDELISAINEFVKYPSNITLHDLYYTTAEFKSSNYKPPVFERPLITDVFDEHPELLVELANLTSN